MFIWLQEPISIGIMMTALDDFAVLASLIFLVVGGPCSSDSDVEKKILSTMQMMQYMIMPWRKAQNGASFSFLFGGCIENHDVPGTPYFSIAGRYTFEEFVDLHKFELYLVILCHHAS